MSASPVQPLPTLDQLGAFELPEVTAQDISGPVSRNDGAYGLPRATEFSDDRDLMNARWVVRHMKRIRELWGPIRAATDRRYAGEGRRGYEQGDWAHVFAVFTMSDTPYLATFWESQQESTLWQEAGFPAVPCFNTLEKNFRRLEACGPVIEAAAYKLMRWAEKCDPRVNQDWHIDGTAYHSAAQLQHCCPNPDTCRAAGGRPPKFVPKLPDQTVKEKRHAVQRSEETKTRADDEVAGIRELQEGELAGFEPDPRYRYQWLNVGGRHRHLYRSLDRDAATRAYTSGRRSLKVWHGGIALASVDNFTGAMNGILFFPADEQEYDHYPALHEKVAAGVGHGPRAMLADRGLHTQSVFEFNTRRGTATIIPWREPAPGRRRRDMRSDEFDEHGVPRCKHCGGETTTSNEGGGFARRQTLGFYIADNGDPRIRYMCALGTTELCRAATPSISCSKEWRMLLPIGLTTDLYFALRSGSKNKENIFYAWRQRYNVAANDKSSRQRIRRRAHLELRAAFGLLIEWFRVCVRHGWLRIPGHERKNPVPGFRRSGRLWLNRVVESRRRRGVAVPYGRYAERAGLLMPDVPGLGQGPPGSGPADHPPPDDNDRPF